MSSDRNSAGSVSEEQYQKGEALSEEYTKKHRVFPTKSLVILIVLLAIQGLLVIFAAVYQPQPLDRIQKYEVTVEPVADGSLDITYKLYWRVLDDEEPLSWIKLGAANPSFSILSYSSNISNAYPYEGGDYIRLNLTENYYRGDTLEFWVKINQGRMLCENENFFYVFIPGWFNSTPVESYVFRWKNSADITSSNSQGEEDGYLVWRGKMPCGTYSDMKVTYNNTAFVGQPTVEYLPFNNEGVNDDLAEDKIGVAVLVVVIDIILLFVEIYIIDTFVSYRRGRGFIRGYGYYVHVYGRTNPHYEAEAAKHSSSSKGGGGGGGCACACACACAGGGRAGCSQKDTYKVRASTDKEIGRLKADSKGVSKADFECEFEQDE